MRKGFENGLTIEEIELYANPKYDWEQMREIRESFRNGLTMEEVKNKYKLANRKNKLNKIARRIK